MDEDYEKLYKPWNWSKRFRDSKSLLENFTNVTVTSSTELINQTKNTRSISYGDSEKQKFDIYYPSDSIANKQQTVIVIIHGGRWQAGYKEIHAFMSKYLPEAGYTNVLIGHGLAPNITLQGIIDEINNGIDYVCNYFPKSNIVIMGYSSGAYLSVSAACNKSLNIKGIIPISGVYDLRPFAKTSFNVALQLTEAEATRLSLHRELSIPAYIKTLILVGEDESPAFIKQNKDLFGELKTNNENVEFRILKDEDHFSIVENFNVKDHPVVQEVLSFLLKLDGVTQ